MLLTCSASPRYEFLDVWREIVFAQKTTSESRSSFLLFSFVVDLDIFLPKLFGADGHTQSSSLSPSMCFIELVGFPHEYGPHPSVDRDPDALITQHTLLFFQPLR